MSPSKNKKINTKCKKVYNCSLGYKKEEKQIVIAMFPFNLVTFSSTPGIEEVYFNFIGNFASQSIFPN